jgi:hypothetical protein
MTNHRLFARFAAVSAACALGIACSSNNKGATTGAGGTDGSGGIGGSSSGEVIGTFKTQALAIANAYTAWGRVDDELRWAPSLCRLPYPGIARPSESNDPTTHGQKLYSVFARNHAEYPNGPHTEQVIVKESWTAELVTDADAGFRPESYDAAAGSSDNFYPYAKSDGGVYRAAEPAGLYIMFKLEPTTPDTDEGWVYATITTTGELTAAGRVASCMGCHEVAPHERLFGVPKSAFQP